MENSGGAITVSFNGPRGFAGDQVRLLTGGYDPTQAIAADMDLDGQLDIVVVNRLTSNLTVFYNEGQRRFSKPSLIAVPSQPVSIVVSDLNNDGLQDIAVATTLGKSIILLFNRGNHQFRAPVKVRLDHVPTMIAGADLDGDGLVDLITLSANSDTITLFKNKGDGTFLNSAELHLLASDARTVIARDINQDGLTDLLTINFGSGDVAVFLNSGDLSFRKPHYVQIGDRPAGGVLADVNGDGLPDLIGSLSDRMVVLLNEGGGKFKKGPVMNLIDPQVPLAADFDGDGAIDLISGTTNKGQIALFINQGRPEPSQTGSGTKGKGRN
jgi:hypothetical protein